MYGTSHWAGEDRCGDTVTHTHLGHVGAKRSELEVRWHNCAVSRLCFRTSVHPLISLSAGSRIRWDCPEGSGIDMRMPSLISI